MEGRMDRYEYMLLVREPELVVCCMMCIMFKFEIVVIITYHTTSSSVLCVFCMYVTVYLEVPEY